jgi:signal transduction histidine kinase
VQIRDNKFLQISVRDTGVGISKENQEKLFKFFGFIKETKDMNKNGVGLGLAISKQIVEQYNGTITVESEPDVGSIFTFCI